MAVTKLGALGKVPPGFHGKKGRSGPKKSPTTLMKEAIDSKREKLGEYLDKLDEMCLDGDREACQYLIDQIKGKAKQQTELEVAGGAKLGTGIIVELYKLMEARWRELNQGQIDLPLSDKLVDSDHKLEQPV